MGARVCGTFGLRCANFERARPRPGLLASAARATRGDKTFRSLVPLRDAFDDDDGVPSAPALRGTFRAFLRRFAPPRLEKEVLGRLLTEEDVASNGSPIPLSRNIFRIFASAC